MNSPQAAVFGADASGAVTAELSEERDLVRVTVASDWERLFAASELGPRIFLAYSDGLSKLPEISYTDLLASNGGADEQDLGAKLREFDGPPRSAESYSEAAQNAIDRAVGLLVDLREAAAAARAASQTAAGTVVFRFSGHWLSGCDVNADWATRKSGAQITAEITAALAQAKSDTGEQATVTKVQGQIQEAVGALLSLGNEAIAALGYYRSQTNEGGH